MMVQITSKKGSALLVTICVLLALLMASLSGLESYSKHFTREIIGQEVRRAQGYYTALAGMRYAAMLLQNPVPFTNHVYTITGRELGGDLFGDLSVTNQNFSVTITEITSGPSAGQFQIDAAYTY